LSYEYTKKIAKYYDQRAEGSTDIISAAGQWTPKELTSEICDEISSKINFLNDEKIIEVGSGSDVLGKHLRTKCKFYVGIDISNSMLKKSLTETNEKINLIQAATHALPFRDGYFNTSIMNSVGMYLRDEGLLKKTVLEMERVTTKKGTIFIGENISPSRIYWEYTWFQNLNSNIQLLAKYYIKIRINLAKKSIFAGKWKEYYQEISFNLLKKIFKDRALIKMTDAAAFSIRKKHFGKNAQGNHRVDFLIKLK
jgi:ubiquinone/menaquinone biosynthesis C-methylase UbiE